MTGTRPTRQADPQAAAPPATAPRWVPWSAMLTAAAGIGVATYLTIEHFTGATTLACPHTGTLNCQKVTTSPESVFLGVPVALLGLLYFAAMLVANMPAAWRSPARWLRTGRLALAAIGILFVLYLLYVELFTVNAICLWCTAVHVLTVGLFAIICVGTALTAVTSPPTGAPRGRTAATRTGR